MEPATSPFCQEQAAPRSGSRTLFHQCLVGHLAFPRCQREREREREREGAREKRERARERSESEKEKSGPLVGSGTGACLAEGEFLIDNLLVRIHSIILMILVDRPCALGV